MKWLNPGSPAHNVLVRVLTDKRRLKTMRLLNHGQYTSTLENLHSVILAYAPKRFDFDPISYNTRVRLAIIDHNVNVTRAALKGNVEIVIIIKSA